MRGLIFTCIIFVFTVFTPLFAREGMEGLRYGKLENGLTYYVKHSEGALGRVSFYLVQNVGAILEDGVMPYLRGKGVFSFNAHTGVNQTVYNINDVPTADQGLVDTCLFIVKDWCSEILLKDKDIDDERGVIIEEWRSRYDVNRRLQEGAAPVVYNHTKYAWRNVIGTVELLKSFPYDALREFYYKWYRPDLQCVIVVRETGERVVRGHSGTGEPAGTLRGGDSRSCGLGLHVNPRPGEPFEDDLFPSAGTPGGGLERGGTQGLLV